MQFKPRWQPKQPALTRPPPPPPAPPRQIAALSAQLQAKATSPKYSFSLVSGAGEPRVSNVSITLNGAVVAEPAFTVVSALAPEFSDFGINGTDMTKLMRSNGVVSILGAATGDARYLLNTDGFTGNQNGGSDGASLAYVQLAASKLTLPVGDNVITLAARLKGLDGAADVESAVTTTLSIKAPDC